jgi:hypothetical protein
VDLSDPLKKLPRKILDSVTKLLRL